MKIKLGLELNVDRLWLSYELTYLNIMCGNIMCLNLC